MRRLAALCLALALAVPLANAAPVLEHGARFERTQQTEAGRLRLAGTGVATYRVLFTVYAAALYVPPWAPSSQVLDDDTPRQLAIEYFYDISTADLVRAANTVLERQLDDATRRELAPAIRRFHALYKPVREGDRYTMTYRPGHGTRLALNGRTLGSVPGAAFARAYFGIWLADGGLSASLRADLTSRLPPSA